MRTLHIGNPTATVLKHWATQLFVQRAAKQQKKISSRAAPEDAHSAYRKPNCDSIEALGDPVVRATCSETTEEN